MDDFRNSIAGAGPLGSVTLWASLNGILDPAGDIDVAQTYLVAGLTYDFSLWFDYDGPVSAPRLELFDASGLRLVESTSPGSTYTGFSFAATYSGAYYLFSRADDGQIGSYGLSLAGGVGTDADETFTGAASNDGIDGAGGDDVVRGNGGNDSLTGGEGDDVLYGGDGDDGLSNGSGSDVLYGGDGDDAFSVSGDTSNQLFGGAGDDDFYLYSDGYWPDDMPPFVENTINGGAGNDTFHLGIVEPAYGPPATIDLVAQTVTFADPAWRSLTLVSIENAWGSDAYDTMVGTNGANFFDGGYGGDTLYGGGGADELYGGISGNDLIYGGDGDDYVDGGWDIYSINDTDKLYGGNGNDVLVGNKFDDTLDGGSGNDLLYGGPRDEETGEPYEDDLDFDDTLYGGAGADRLFGGYGDDVMTGGAETDTFFGGSGSDTVLFTGITTNMRVDLSLGRATLPGTTSLSESLTSIENAETGSGDDALIGGGGANRLLGGLGDDSLTGGAGDDDLYGGDGADSFDGGAGADRLYGGNGDDTLLGGTDIDLMDGGAGIDTVRVSGAAAARIDLGLGRMSFPATPGTETLTSIENATGAAGADALIGGAGANLLRGAAGADRLTGAGGADTLVGGTENDVFVFLAASDSRKGAADRIIAGDGGAAFQNAGGAAGDRIDLAAIDAVTGGDDQAFKFGTATGAGRLWLVEVGANTHVRGNVDADAAYEFELVIEDGALRASAYTAADFML